MPGKPFDEWKGCISMPKTTPLSLHSTSPRLRTGESRHLVCFWLSPTSMARREHFLRTWSAVMGRNGPFVSMCGRVHYALFRCKTAPSITATFSIISFSHMQITAPSKKHPHPLSLHSASPRLRTGESLHLVCFWLSPTSMARREHHRCATGVRHMECVSGSERSVSVSGRGALLSIDTTKHPHPLLSLHSASPRLRTGESRHPVCFWLSPTSMARREHHLCAPGVRGWVRTVRFCEWKGCIAINRYNKTSPSIIIATFSITPSPHRRITAPSLLLAFAHIHGEAGTPTGGVGSAVVGLNSPVLCAGGVLFPVSN
jgi:hypothetical protein